MQPARLPPPRQRPDPRAPARAAHGPGGERAVPPAALVRDAATGTAEDDHRADHDASAGEPLAEHAHRLRLLLLAVAAPWLLLWLVWTALAG